MKKIILSVLLVFTVFRVFAAANPDSLVKVANNYYVNNDFQMAAETYKKVIEMGYMSPELYYNLGNSYFKLNNYAYSIIYYERALLLKPNDKDVKHNLELANAHTIDKIDVIPEFFVKKWIESLIASFSSNTWAITSMITFVIFIFLLLVYLLSGKMVLKQMSFYLFILFFLVSVSFFYFSAERKKTYLQNSEAIVISPSVTAKSSPTEYGTDIFILHEGTKVEIVDSVGEWNEIRISNGNKAWIIASAIEKI